MTQSGKTTKQLQRLYLRHKGKCLYCGCPTIFRTKHVAPEHLTQDEYDRTATRDHVKPVGKGGRNTMSNLVLACQKCNHTKADDYLPDLPARDGWVVDLTKDPNWPAHLFKEEI